MKAHRNYKTSLWLAFVLLLFVSLHHACSDDLDEKQQEQTSWIEEVEGNEMANYIIAQLNDFPENNFKALTREYGTPNWEFAHIRRQVFSENEEWIVPLQNKNGRIENVLIYTPPTAKEVVEENNNRLDLKIANATQIENSESLERYRNSMLFYTFTQRGAKVDTAALYYAKKSFESNHMAPMSKEFAEMSQTKYETNEGVTYGVMIDIHEWVAYGLNCVDKVVSASTVESYLNACLNVAHEDGQLIFKKNSVAIFSRGFKFTFNCIHYADYPWYLIHLNEVYSLFQRILVDLSYDACFGGAMYVDLRLNGYFHLIRNTCRSDAPSSSEETHTGSYSSGKKPNKNRDKDKEEEEDKEEDFFIEIFLPQGNVARLLDPYDVNVQLRFPTESTIDLALGIAREGEDFDIWEEEKMPINSIQHVFTVIPRNSGHFKLKVRATINGNKHVFTNELNIEHLFPDYNSIVANPVYKNHMNNLWQKTLDACNPETCREYQSVFYMNTQNGAEKVYTASTIAGKEYPSNFSQTLDFSINPNSDFYTSGVQKGGSFYIAFFHTHPPRSYVTSRKNVPVGPSQKDLKPQSNTPAILMDYKATSFDGETNIGEVPKGHPKNAASMLYNHGGYRRNSTNY